MIPPFNEIGNLPSGVYWVTWEEFQQRFGHNDRRKKLLTGLYFALEALQKAGCETVYIDGSFVTNKKFPADFDGCWEVSGVSLQLLDPILMDFRNERKVQKERYYGELFPNVAEKDPETSIFEWFQIDKYTGNRKGIIAIDLRDLP